MHKQFLPLLFAAFAIAKPQSLPDISGIPTCARTIVLAQITATSCGTDIACVCHDTAFIGNLRNLITSSCGEADAAAAEQYYKTTCAQNGVTVDAAASTPAMDSGAGATVTSTMSMMPSNTDMAASNMTMMGSSVTGNPSMTATTDMMMSSATLGGDMGQCTVTTTTVCHTATVAPTSTGMNPSAWTGAADVVGVSGVLAGLAVVAAIL